MAARVIHFGEDDCHRLMVLRLAGYSVDECNSLVQLRSALLTDGSADAFCVTEGYKVAPEEAIHLVRAHTRLPVVLFKASNQSYDGPIFDLVVPSLTPPDVWLNEMERLIAQSKAVRDNSQALIKRSGDLRRQSEALRKKSSDERERSRRERERTAGSVGDDFSGAGRSGDQ